MTFRITWRLTAVGLSALLPALAAASAEEAPRSGPRPLAPESQLALAAEPGPTHPRGRGPARVYTNDDLERVHPRRGETGVLSVPARPPVEAERAPRRAPSRGQGEAYWRREAERVRERLRGLEERAATLRAQIAERARESQVFGARRRASSGSPTEAALRASLAAVERRARLTQDDLEERARRDGALPGWLR